MAAFQNSLPVLKLYNNFIFRNKFITGFLRLNLGNLGELLIFQIDCIESPTYRHAIIISEINLFI